MEKQVLAAKVLAPKRLRLTFKETPVREAVAGFAKKSGYAISLHDPKNTLKDRKITLDTGETTFWQAFDQFCAKASLSEATQQDLVRVAPLLPPGGIQPPRRILPAPRPPLRIQPPMKQQTLGQQTEQFQFVLAQQNKNKPAPAPVQAQLPAIQILPAPAQPGMWRAGFKWRLAARAARSDHPQGRQGQGRADGLRRRRPPSSARQAGSEPLSAARGEMLLGLQISLEPKIRWQNLLGVRIDKAVDDQDQTLAPGMGGTPGVPPGGGPPPLRIGGGFGGAGMAVRPLGWNPGYGGLHHYFPVRLKKGDKASKSLKELSGSLTASVLAEPETLLSADNILKAAGKTFKGKKDGGAIKVNGVEENNGLLRLRVELQQPANVVPANQGNAGVIGVFNGPVGGPMILPIWPPGPAPLPPAKPRLKGAFQQIQFQPAQVQAVPAQIQIQIQVGGGGPAFFGGNTNGLELLDDKGNVIPNAGVGMMGRGGPGGVFTREYQLTFRLQKGQKPARLVFKGSKRVNVEIPFRFKNVQLP